MTDRRLEDAESEPLDVKDPNARRMTNGERHRFVAEEGPKNKKRKTRRKNA